MGSTEPAPPQTGQILATSVPEFYTDGSLIEVTPFTVTLTFLVGGQRPVGVVRMSPSQAKTLIMLMKQFLKQAEEKFGEPIVVPEVVLKDRNISLDDW